jgi:hypothetical protein
VSDRLRPAARDTSWCAPHKRREPGLLLNLLREAYPDPEPFLTAEDFARHHHDDIRALTDDALENERLLSYLRRACERIPGAWLMERISRLDAEATRRKRSVAKR